MTLSLTKQQVKNYLINRSFLVNKSSTILEVLNYLSCIQVDPINAVARSHEFALYNRVKNFKIQDLYNELYKKRSLTEYWLQLYSILPIENFSKLTARIKGEIEWRKDYYKIHKKEINEVLELLNQKESISYKDILHLKGVGGLYSWRNSDSPKALLEYLWDMGIIVIVDRKSNTKHYSLTSKVFPNLKLESKKASQKFILESQFSYLGMVRKSYFIKYGVNYKKAVQIVETFEEYKSKNKLVELKIEGVKTQYYILKTQLEELKKLSQKQEHFGVNILPPLDPLVIDRRILSEIFDFEYLWEAYIPESKRKFAHYGMPILFQGEFVGLAELKKDGNKIKLNKLRIEKPVEEKLVRKAIKVELKEMSKTLISN